MLEPEDIAAVHLAVMKPVGIAADEMQAGTTELGGLFSDQFGKRRHILRIEGRAGIGHDEHETPREESNANGHSRRPVGRETMNDVVREELVEREIDPINRDLGDGVLRPECLYRSGDIVAVKRNPDPRALDGSRAGVAAPKRPATAEGAPGEVAAACSDRRSGSRRSGSCAASGWRRRRATRMKDRLTSLLRKACSAEFLPEAAGRARVSGRDVAFAGWQ